MMYTPSWLNADLEWEVEDGPATPFISIGFGSGRQCYPSFCIGPFPPFPDTWYTQVGSFVAKSRKATLVLDLAMAGAWDYAFALVDNVVFTAV
jgi:hypothetical protein